jgi:hypothetical protein
LIRPGRPTSEKIERRPEWSEARHGLVHLSKATPSPSRPWLLAIVGRVRSTTAHRLLRGAASAPAALRAGTGRVRVFCSHPRHGGARPGSGFSVWPLALRASGSDAIMVSSSQPCGESFHSQCGQGRTGASNHRCRATLRLADRRHKPPRVATGMLAYRKSLRCSASPGRPAVLKAGLPKRQSGKPAHDAPAL